MQYTTAPYYFLSFVLPPRSAPLSSHNSPHSLIHYLQYPTRFFTILSYGPQYRYPALSLTQTHSLHHPTPYPSSLCKDRRGDIPYFYIEPS